jgi:hypothetical protein
MKTLLKNWKRSITESQLRSIIKQELRKTLKEMKLDVEVEDVFSGNCGIFAIALAEEAKRRGLGEEAALVFAHNAETDEELKYGEYSLYHVAFQIGDKLYDGRGEISEDEIISFMWTTPKTLYIDAFNLVELEMMKDAIRRNTAWNSTCEYYEEIAKEFLDKMGYDEQSLRLLNVEKNS